MIDFALPCRGVVQIKHPHLRRLLPLVRLQTNLQVRPRYFLRLGAPPMPARVARGRGKKPWGGGAGGGGRGAVAEGEALYTLHLTLALVSPPFLTRSLLGPRDPCLIWYRPDYALSLTLSKSYPCIPCLILRGFIMTAPE
jgi:hypothetical protein